MGYFLGKFTKVCNDQKGCAETLLVFDKKGVPLTKFKLPYKGSHFGFSKDGKELYHFTLDINVDVMQVGDLLDVLNK